PASSPCRSRTARATLRGWSGPSPWARIDRALSARQLLPRARAAGAFGQGPFRPVHLDFTAFHRISLLFTVFHRISRGWGSLRNEMLRRALDRGGGMLSVRRDRRKAVRNSRVR